MNEAINVAGSENKAAAELEGIQAESVLMMACGTRAIAAGKIIAAENVQQVGGAQIGSAIGFALLVDQEGKGDAGLLAKNAGIVAVAKANGGEGSALVPEGLLVFAQLRDVLAAEDSSIVAEKNYHGGLTFPQRAKTDFAAFGIGKNDTRQPLAECFNHPGNSTFSPDSKLLNSC